MHVVIEAWVGMGSERTVDCCACCNLRSRVNVLRKDRQACSACCVMEAELEGIMKWEMNGNEMSTGESGEDG